MKRTEITFIAKSSKSHSVTDLNQMKAYIVEAIIIKYHTIKRIAMKIIKTI